MENEKNGEQSETNQAGTGNEEYIRQIEALKKEVDEWQMRCFRAEQEVSMLLRDSEWKGTATWSTAQDLLRDCGSVNGDTYREEFLYLVNLLERDAK